MSGRASRTNGNESFSDSNDPYVVLGVSKTATASNLRRAYRAAILRAHPNKGGSNHAFRKVQNAYKRLKPLIDIEIPITVRIDHGNLSYASASTLQKRIGYPKSNGSYKGRARLQAVLRCLRRIRETDEERLAIFAHCLSRDKRMSNRLRKFASNAIFKSMSVISTKKRALRFKEEILEIEESVRWRMRFDHGPHDTESVRSHWMATLRRLGDEYKQEVIRTANDVPEWDTIGYGKAEFEKRIDEEIHVQTTLVAIKGVGKMPLPDNLKRLVLEKTKESNLPIKTKRTFSTRGPGNEHPLGRNSGSNWNNNSNTDYGSNTGSSSSSRSSNGRRSPRSNGSRSPRRNVGSASSSRSSTGSRSSRGGSRRT